MKFHIVYHGAIQVENECFGDSHIAAIFMFGAKVGMLHIIQNAETIILR